ncbi:hypothetical protein MM440_01105 [Arsenicicoccus piscis]|uniref:hypothetical protein n=1 Tax=Arsenicicoccus piscis TaxID=673954 RepID=UPI001F4C56CA|nr:hypothetical protein [Arsenicicoccus piscis]MCH8626419.1 hypothetical protein [Arsenicicoccus piscis]
MTTPEQRLHLRLRPATRSGTGVLLVAGSSGRIDEGRARLLAAHGADVLVLRWFGAPGLQPGPFEVPLELFVEALDDLAVDNERLAVVGLSFGAEAALLLASKDARVETVVAFAPSAYVWAGVPDSAPGQTSHWTWAGLPVPFVPFVEEWEPTRTHRPTPRSTRPVWPPQTRRRWPLRRSRSTASQSWCWSQAATTRSGPQRLSRATSPAAAPLRVCRRGSWSTLLPVIAPSCPGRRRWPRAERWRAEAPRPPIASWARGPGRTWSASFACTAERRHG